MIAELSIDERSARKMRWPVPLVVLAFWCLGLLGAVSAAHPQETFSDGFESGNALAWSFIRPPLDVEILSPTQGSATPMPTIDVSGTFSGSPPAIEVNGIAGEVVDRTFTVVGVPLVEGDNLLELTALNSLGQEATDSVVVHLDSTPTVIVITSPVDGLRTTASSIDVEGTIDEAVAVEVNGVAAVVVGLTFSATVPLIEGDNLLVVTAGSGMASVSVVRDTTGPLVDITAPLEGSLTTNPEVEVSGTLNEIAVVTVNGLPATVTGLDFTALVTLLEGPNVLVAEATDDLGNIGSDAVTVTLDTIPPLVTIEAPADGTRTVAGTIEVSGTAKAGSAVQVNGIPAQLSGTEYSVIVPLAEGSNVLTAQATDAAGLIGTASVQVLRDSTPPLVAILSPLDGAILTGAAPLTATVTGTVHDAASGSVNPGDCEVVVNGVVAEIANGGWAAFDVPIAIGAGTLTVVATDALGNSSGLARQVVGNAQAGAFLEVVSGSGQSAEVGAALADPLVVRARDNAGNPVAGVEVTFTINRGDGELGNGARVEVATTSASGQASVAWALGSRAGVASDQVEATATGFLGSASFYASATVSPLAARRLLPSSGFNQRVAVGSEAPERLTVRVVDANGNPVAGDPVTFAVEAGGGQVDGAALTTVTSDDDGLAAVRFTAGSLVGVDLQEVLAEVSGVADSIRFAISAVVPGDPAATAVSGVVLTNENEPIADATVRLTGADPPRVTTTDTEGQFALAGVPPGPAHLEVDGTTGGPYPSLELELHLVSGIDNRLERAVYLPLLDDDGLALANPATDVVITRADIPGLSLTIPAETAEFADGTQEGWVQIVPVNRDKIPMAPENGTIPSLPISVQPADVHFDPPAPLRLPNVEGLAPGLVVPFYSFDHDVGAFVEVGTMQVTEDGAFLESEPGQGVVKGGWHYTPPTPPEQVTVGLNEALIRCVDATTCFSCTKVGAICDCTVKPYNGPGVPISTPDFDCFLFPADPGGDPDYPCDLVGPKHFTGGIFTPDPTCHPPAIFKPAGSLCTRLYEAPPSPLVGIPPGTDFRCRTPPAGNPLGLPVCCPESHWDGTACRNNPVCTPGNDADGDRLDDCFETGTGVFVDATDTGTNPNDPDTDDDGLEDGDEVLGTTAGLDLPGLGVSPLRQDILLEYDWFDDGLECAAHSHRPTAAAVNEVTATFANAPVTNPDGSMGITLIHDYGQGGLLTGGNLIADPDGVLVGGVNDAEYMAHKLANFAANRQGYFHYVLLPHRYNVNSGSSGQAELPGNDFIVSLYCFGSDHNVAHTIVHELGHNLTLRHGGSDNCNYKPNYNSVMNYLYQFPGVDMDCNGTPGIVPACPSQFSFGDGALDLSTGGRPDLDEMALDETLGVCGAPGLDWNINAVFPENPVAFDINSCDPFQAITCGGTQTVLRDFDDWGNLSLLGVDDVDGVSPLPEIIDCENPPPP